MCDCGISSIKIYILIRHFKNNRRKNVQYFDILSNAITHTLVEYGEQIIIVFIEYKINGTTAKPCMTILQFLL